MLEILAKPGFRKASANLGWLLAERLGRLVLATLVGLLVARYLGPARFGSLNYVVALISLLTFLPALGLDAVLKREWLKSPEQAGELMGSALMLRAVAAAVTFAGAVIFALFGPGFAGDEAKLMWVLAFLLFQPVLFLPELWLQTQLRAKQSVQVQLGALLVASAIRVGLIATQASVVAFAWVLVVEMVLGAAGFWLVVRSAGLRGSFFTARRERVRHLIAEAWPLMFASLAVIVYMKIDEVMLRQLAGPTEVGIYSAAAKLSEMWYFIPTALASSVLPALLRARERDAQEYTVRQQQYYDLSAALAYGLSIPLALAAPWVVRVAYGAEFAAAGPILAVHIWSSLFVFLGVARGQWLVNEGLQKFYLAATTAGAVANIVLNLVFIPRWGGLGAAWATLISYGLAAWVASYFHPLVRATGMMQARALLIPVRGWRYLRRA